ncbi:MAG: ketopantoate reductase family protein, partial [Hungatella sp.]
PLISHELRDGRRTEVDAISGAVVRAARKYHVEVPGHEFVVNLIHALEKKNVMTSTDTP